MTGGAPALLRLDASQAAQAEVLRRRVGATAGRSRAARGLALKQYRPGMVTETMSIGALASGTGAPVSTLRFYERNGLLGEPPRVSGQRRYPPEAAERVALIRMWRRAGFSVTEIRTLLADRHRLDDWQDLVRTKIAELGAHVEQIEQSRAELQHALFCRADDWTACSWMKVAARPPTDSSS